MGGVYIIGIFSRHRSIQDNCHGNAARNTYGSQTASQENYDPKFVQSNIPLLQCLSQKFSCTLPSWYNNTRVINITHLICTGKRVKPTPQKPLFLKPPHNQPAAYIFILRYTSGKTINILIKLYYRTTWMRTNNKIMEFFQTTRKSQKNECGISQYIRYLPPGFSPFHSQITAVEWRYWTSHGGTIFSQCTIQNGQLS